jgi:hypothetical protein
MSLLVLIVVLATAVQPALDDTGPLNPGLPLPDTLAYALHAWTGIALGLIGAPAETAGIQWVKAASHAPTFADNSDAITRATEGIQAARARAGYSAYFDTTLCAMVRHGSPPMQAAVKQAGIQCSDAPYYRNHVPEGAAIAYDSQPPIGGPHYDRSYLSYGVVDHSVPPGYWVHNLEHGAVVLLYDCPDGCPLLVNQIQELYPHLPMGHNARHGIPRLLALPYSDLDHRLAVVAWDHVLELDQFDRAQIVAFYLRFLDRGPECSNLNCPE